VGKNTAVGVMKLLTSLNPHKATGPDSIPARLLKEIGKEITPALTFIFQASINQGKIPSVFKKGDRGQPSNYRSISLTSICCKIMEHIIHSSVLTHLENTNILSDEQHGFRVVSEKTGLRSCVAWHVVDVYKEEQGS
jgi:hypothetical protein